MDLLPTAPPDLFGREPERNAFVELHNLVVAGADTPADYGPADADRIARERGIDLRTAFRDERLALYEGLFGEALARGALDDHQCRVLTRAAETLALTAADVQPVHERAFGDAVTVALTDDCLSVGERLHLYALQLALGLDPTRARAATDAPARARLLRVVARVLCDGELSPDEAADVAGAARALGVTVGPDLVAMLDAAANRWKIRSAPMPDLHVQIRLGPNETAHADVPARWADKRSDALRSAFVDGVSNADTRHQRFPWDRFMSPLRPGRIVLTSQRLVLLDAERPTRYVPLASVQDIVVFADGAIVRLASDSRRLVLDLDAGTEAFFALLDRTLAGLPRQPRSVADARWRSLGSVGTDLTEHEPRMLEQHRERLAADPFGWDLPGTVSEGAYHLTLENAIGTHRIATAHSASFYLSDRALCIYQRLRPGWLVLFDRPERAEATFEWLRARVER